jgi:hypothetical protein
MWRIYSPSLYCAIAFCTVAFLRVKPAIALARVANAQVAPLNFTKDVPPIFLGRRSASHYVVIIPASSLDEARSYLAAIRAKVSRYGQMVFVSSHSLGAYIYVAGFNQRYKAENFLRLLHEPRARVVYFP